MKHEFPFNLRTRANEIRAEERVRDGVATVTFIQEYPWSNGSDTENLVQYAYYVEQAFQKIGGIAGIDYDRLDLMQMAAQIYAGHGAVETFLEDTRERK